MKRIFGLIVVVFFYLCSIQNINAQTRNDAQRIVGTWSGIEATGMGSPTTLSYTFNQNGTFTITVGSQTISGTYFLSSSRLFWRAGNTAQGMNYYFSSDGTKLFLQASAAAVGTWLEKQ